MKIIMTRAIHYIKLCQAQRMDAMRNSWKLRNITRKDKQKNIIDIAKRMKIPPLLIIRRLLLLDDLGRKQVNQVLEGSLFIDEKYAEMIDGASQHDFINTPLANKRAKERGLEGELILREWMEHLNLEYGIDLANGISMPDILLKNPMSIYDLKVDWIESKSSFGGKFEMFKHSKQFKRFDKYGKGIIVFWFGYEYSNGFNMISGTKIKRLMPPNLRQRVTKMLDFVPPEYTKWIKEYGG